MGRPVCKSGCECRSHFLKGRKAISSSERSEIERLHSIGTPVWKIGDFLNRDRHVVSRVLREKGLTIVKDVSTPQKGQLRPKTTEMWLQKWKDEAFRCKKREVSRRTMLGLWKTPGFAKKVFKPVQTELGHFRSKHEAAVAEELQRFHLQWLYEPESFDLRPWYNITYTPDFFVPECGVWLEIKPWDPEQFGQYQRIVERFEFVTQNQILLIAGWRRIRGLGEELRGFRK